MINTSLSIIEYAVIQITDDATGNKIVINRPLFQNITGEALRDEAKQIFKDLGTKKNQTMIFNPTENHGSIEQFLAFRAADWKKFSQQAINCKPKKNKKLEKVVDYSNLEL